MVIDDTGDDDDDPCLSGLLTGSVFVFVFSFSNTPPF